MRFVWVLFVGALVLVSCAASVETAVGSRSASSSSAAVSMTVPPMMSSDISVSSESSPEEIEAKLQAMADSDFEESTNEYHSTASCDNQFPDAKTISVNKFVDDLADVVDSVEQRDIYDFVTLDGTRSRLGPRAFWMQEAFEKHLANYEPSEFAETRLGEKSFLWSNYIRWREAVCRAKSGNGSIRDSVVEHGRFTHYRTDWPGHASNWQPFPYLDIGSQVVAAPTINGLEHYKKYTAGAGIVIVGGAEVPDAAMLQARKSVVYQTSARPEFRDMLIDSRVRISLFASEDTSGLPEYQGEFEPGGFAQGLTDASMTANANWVCFHGNPDRGGDPILHEMVHTLNHVVFEQLNETYFYERIYKLAEKAIKKGVFIPGDQYLPDGDEAEMVQWVGEYWATTVEGYLMDRAGFKNSHDTREWIERNDPDLYEMIVRYFPTAPWNFCPEIPSGS